MAGRFSTKQLDAFNKAASSLKLFSRAELADERNRNLVEKLYVDPLPNDQIFKTLMGDNTTFLIGRKGTGKSTVFQRAQHEIRKNKTNIISAYMDIRNTFESSQIDQQTIDKLESHSDALSASEIKKLLLYKRFLRTLLSEIRNELKIQVNQNFLSKIKDSLLGTSTEVFAKLDGIIATLESPTFEDVSGVSAVKIKDKADKKRTKKRSASGELAISPEKGLGSLAGKAGAETESVDGLG